MRIDEKDGKRYVVFEAEDAELKENFLREIAKEEELVEAASQLKEQHDKICRELHLAVKRLELHRLEHRDEKWKLVEMAVAEVLESNDVPPLTYNRGTGELWIDDKVREDPTPPPGMKGLLQVLGLPMSSGMEGPSVDDDDDDDDGLLH